MYGRQLNSPSLSRSHTPAPIFWVTANRRSWLATMVLLVVKLNGECKTSRMRGFECLHTTMMGIKLVLLIFLSCSLMIVLWIENCGARTHTLTQKKKTIQALHEEECGEDSSAGSIGKEVPSNLGVDTTTRTRLRRNFRNSLQL